MKTINRLLILLAVFGLSTSCQVDVLPPTGIPAESFWKTDKDAWYALNKIYRTMPDFWKLISDEMTTDNAHSQKPWEGNMEILQQDGINAATSWGSYTFGPIRDVNTYLANVDKCALDAGLKERTKAEARFFRALAYLNLTVYYGKVAIITEPLAYDAPNVSRNSVAEVQKFILEELAAVAAVLPPSYTGGGQFNESSRVTNNAAHALRARAALYFGNFAEAEVSADAVIRSGKHRLFKLTSLNANQQKEADEMDAYIDWAAKGVDKNKFMLGLFSCEALWQEPNALPTNPEYILTREYAPDASTVDLRRYTALIPLHMSINQGYSSIKPLQDMVSAYWDIDGQTIPAAIPVATRKANYETVWSKAKVLKNNEYNAFATAPELLTSEYIKEFRNRDSRLYASVIFPFKGWHNSAKGPGYYYRFDPETIGKNGNESWSGFSFRKFVSITPFNKFESSDDLALIRYAEVLLTYAEAHTINVGYDASVEAALNELRDRCGMPNVPSGLGKEAALDFIRNERRIELMGEGHRFADIRRYGNGYAKKMMSGPTTAPDGSVVVNKVWSDRLMLMPIPTSAIDANPLLLTDQNAGY